jgi:hypothetical protein
MTTEQKKYLSSGRSEPERRAADSEGPAVALRHASAAKARVVYFERRPIDALRNAKTRGR